MKHLNDLATVQAERKAKSYSAPAERQRAAAANAASVDSETVKPQKPKIQKQTTHENESETKTLFAEVRELRSELAELKRNFAGKRTQQAPRFQKTEGEGEANIKVKVITADKVVADNAKLMGSEILANIVSIAGVLTIFVHNALCRKTANGYSRGARNNRTRS